MRIAVRALMVMSISTLVVAAAGTARASFPGLNGKIAFSSARDANYEIYVMKADASGQTRITNDPGTDIDPAWSPNGSAIAFTSNDDIYVMNADGSGRTRLTSDPAADNNAAWAPDGAKIAFASARDGNGEIYAMNVDGSGIRRLTDNPAPDAVPAWSPDGTRIAFTSSRSGNSDIYVMNADGSDPRPLTTDAAADIGPNWSPDGSRIAFWSRRDGNPEIYVMNADGTGQTRLTRNLADDLDPAWSPDGKSIAFTSNRDGNDEIYVMNADGSGETRLTTNVADDTTPDWQPLPVPQCENALDYAAFVGHWRESSYDGLLDFRGTQSGASRFQLVLRRGTKTYLSKEITLDTLTGPFNGRLRLPPGLLPGPYVLDWLPGAGPAELCEQHVSLTLAAPPEGVVGKAWASETKGGEPLVRFPSATTTAWANFRFAALPKRGAQLTITWYHGPKSKLIGVAQVRRKPLVASYVERGGEPLLRGTREAVLRAGDIVVKRLRFRIG